MTFTGFIVLLKVPIIMGLIMYWCCKEEERRLQIAVSFSMIQMLIIMLLNTTLMEKSPFQYPVMLLQNTIILMYGICFFKRRFYTTIKTMCYIVLHNLFFYMLSVADALIFPNLSKVPTSAMSAKGVFCWPLILSGTLFLTYCFIKKRFFEKLPFGLISGIVIVFWSGDIIGLFVVVPMRTSGFASALNTLYSAAFMVIIVMLAFVRKMLQINQEKAVCQKLLDNQYDFYQDLYRKQAVIRKLRHDMANHIQVMQSLAENEKNEEEMDYQKNVLKVYDSFSNSLEKTEDVQNKKKISIHWKNILFILFIIVMMGVILGQMIPGFQLVFEDYQSIIVVSGAVILLSGTILALVRIIQEQKLKNMQIILENGNKQKTELEELQQQMDQLVNQPITSSPVSTVQPFVEDDIVNAMLNSKYQQCMAKGIQTKWNIQMPAKMPLEPAEQVGLMSNLLDNAMEACLRKEESDSHIYLNAHTKANFWSIVIQNSKNTEEAPVKKRFATGKKGDHGLGLDIVRNIVKKHDGMLEFQDQGGEFVVTVMLQTE